MSNVDIFSQINNAVLDLQASQLQTFERPLKNLSRLLNDSTLSEIRSELISSVDFEEFISKSEGTQGGMIGSAQLVWPENPNHVLGLSLLLLDNLAGDSNYAIDFSHRFFYSGNKVIAGIHSLTRQFIIPFVRDFKIYATNAGKVEPKLIKPKSQKVFIVHGHDEGARESVARFITNIGLTPIILHEQANRGRTVIEKVEAHSDVSFAVVLLTPDDLGKAKNSDELEPRVRQNVLLELGYFFGRLGRENVCALKRGNVEIPSDFAGVVWENMDSGNGWKQALGRELEASGQSIDWNVVMRS